GCNLDQLRSLAAITTRTKNRVAVSQTDAALTSRKTEFLGELGKFEFPNGFSPGINFTGQRIRFVGNEGIAILQPDRRPGRADGVGPDFIEIAIKLHHLVRLQAR